MLWLKFDCELFELDVGADFVTSGVEILSVDVDSEGQIDAGEKEEAEGETDEAILIYPGRYRCISKNSRYERSKGNDY